MPRNFVGFGRAVGMAIPVADLDIIVLIKGTGICIIAQVIKHGCLNIVILSHGGTQMNLPKLYCKDIVIRFTQT